MATIKKQNWKEFNVYPGVNGIKAKALVERGEVLKVRLISHVPSTYYYSCLNDAGLEADKLFAK